ncbi:SprT family protein [Oenococcus sp.]|uniref:SprT family protein n=1 Tax=Oenococcus sp. TaxID=1979414 RepID=UPI0039EC3DDC
MTEINQIDLQALVERLSLTYFKMPFQHQVRFNSRLRSTGGRVVFPRRGSRILETEIYMEVNPKLSNEQLPGIIKHELAHYMIYLQKGLHHENDRDFQRLLVKVAAPKYSPLVSVHKSAYLYRCQGTQHHEFKRSRKVDIRRMRCGIDGSRLMLVSEYHAK